MIVSISYPLILTQHIFYRNTVRASFCRLKLIIVYLD
jgi:hypothetical protein